MSTIPLADVVQQHREKLEQAATEALAHFGNTQTPRADARGVIDVLLAELDRLADGDRTPGEQRHADESGGQAPTAQDRERISDYDNLADAIRDYFGDGGEQPWLVVHGDGETVPVRALSSSRLPQLSIRGLIQLGAAVVARGDHE